MVTSDLCFEQHKLSKLWREDEPICDLAIWFAHLSKVFSHVLVACILGANVVPLGQVGVGHLLCFAKAKLSSAFAPPTPPKSLPPFLWSIL